MENDIKIIRKGEKLINFMKKYGYFIVAGLIVAAITLTVIFTTGAPLNIIDDDDDDDTDTNTGALTFMLPLADCTVSLDFSIDKLIYHASLGWYATHNGVDLVSSTTSDVVAACAGTVTEIYTNDLEGTVIKIKHNDSYTTLYGSLSENVTVSVGDTVVTGQKIGTASASADNESSIGAHLHFQIIKDNTEVNPNDYLDLQNK